MENADAAGRQLAERHQATAAFDEVDSLLNYAERPRIDDWSLRSALVRFAQGHPVRAGAILEMTRRCDATLSPHTNTLSARCVNADRQLTPEALLQTPPLDPLESYPDARVTDLARIMGASPESSEEFLAAYGELVEAAGAPLDPTELAAAELLVIVLELDRLSEALCQWASGHSGEAPVALVDEVIPQVKAELDALGVSAETGPPGRRGSRGDQRP